VKSHANGSGPGVAGECAGGPPGPATPLLTTGKSPAHDYHWAYLV